jgi:hypothetical protein
MFTAYPTYPHYRALTDRTPNPLMHGEDAYGLQLGITAVIRDGTTLEPDGIVGRRTGAAIWEIQQEIDGLIPDGKAGQKTQAAIAEAILVAQTPQQPDLYRLEVGQLEHESSFWLGNYSEQHPIRPGVTPAVPGGDFDAGVAQRNSEFTPLKQAFNPVLSIAALVENTRRYYTRFSDKSRFRGSDHSELRRWKLAAGAWNAWAYANWLAGFSDSSARDPNKDGSTALAKFEAYMTDVSVYLD